MRYSILLSASALAIVPITAQQTVPTRALTKADAEYSEPFSQLVGLRELRDGRVIAADLRDKTLQAIDLNAKKAARIGREGSGPGEWLMPLRVFPLPGDSTLVYDIGNTRFLVVGPDAQPVRVFTTAGDSPEADGPGRGDGARSGRGDGGRGGRGDGRGDAGRGGGRAGAFAIAGMSPPRAADARGRTYSMGVPITIKDDGTVTSADSAPILRYDVATKKSDTVAYVNLAKNSASGSISGGGGRQEQTVSIGAAGPYAPADDWTVLPDGRIVIARVSDYHVEVVTPGGRRAVGQPVRYAPVRIGEAEKQEWRDSRKSGAAVQMRVDDNNGARSRSVSNAPPTSVPEPAAWPATKPPFQSGAVLAAPNGETWVMRTRAASDKVPSVDVFDGQGRLVGRVTLPVSTRLVGFGPKGVYLVRIDDDDLQYLQRYGMTWTGCPVEMKESCNR